MPIQDYAKSLLTEITGAGENELAGIAVTEIEETVSKAERAKAESELAEAMRVTNGAIRRVHKLGLAVDADILMMYSPRGPIPQLNISATQREPKSV